MSFVKINDFSKSYDNVQAVKNFSLEIEKGEIVALVGPDGAGKTTIMRALCSLISPYQGSLFIADHDVKNNFDQIKNILGYMPQTFSLYPDLSVRENLQFFGGLFGVMGRKFKEKSEQLYKFSNLKPFEDRRAQFLSGGMKQKLALSCALIHEPEILILDEPTTGVDPLSRQQFWEILKELRLKGVTLLVSTPYMDEVGYADRACFLFNGLKLVEGTPDELVKMFQGKVFYYSKKVDSFIINDLEKIDGLSVRRFGNGLHIYITPDKTIELYRDDLQKLGIEIDNLKMIEPDLEDCFIQMMGGESEQ